MAVNRKIRKGLVEKTLCFIGHKGRAPVPFMARYFHQSERSMDKILNKLESRGFIRDGFPMYPGTYYLTNKGHSHAGTTRCSRILPSAFPGQDRNPYGRGMR